MLSLEKAKKLIPNSETLSDKEVLELLENLYEMGQLGLEDFYGKRKGSKNP